MNTNTGFKAAVVVVLSAVSLTVAPAAFAKPIAASTLSPGQVVVVHGTHNPAQSSDTATVQSSDSKAPSVLLSQAALAHARGGPADTPIQVASQPTSSSSSWSDAAIVVAVLAVVAGVVGLGALLIGATTRRRQAIG